MLKLVDKMSFLSVLRILMEILIGKIRRYILREPFTMQSAAGAVLVLGSTLWSELGGKKN